MWCRKPSQVKRCVKLGPREQLFGCEFQRSRRATNSAGSGSPRTSRGGSFGRAALRHARPSSTSARIIAHRLGTPRLSATRRPASTRSNCCCVTLRPSRTNCGLKI